MRLSSSTRGGPDDMLREAAWMARCVGRGEWAPLSEADIGELGSRLAPVDFEPGAPLFAQGTPSEGVWVVRSGRAELIRHEGPRRTILKIMYPGDVDGDISLILRTLVPYSARAVDRMQALRLSAEDFEWLVAARPAVARRWMSSIAARLMHAERRILQLSGRDLREQVAALLLDEAHEGAVELPQDSLASLLGVRRQSLNKALRDLERRGSVRLSYRRVDLLDPSALMRVSGRKPQD